MSVAGFELCESREIATLKVVANDYRDHRTGARHLHFAAADDNNAFMVVLPTMPEDSTGVAHVLEHTTLCGSRRYPVRDPFFLMLRRSLNTYMNAFTAPDSTAYPFATRNRRDFDNLLGVYLDAVFFPLLDPLDFAQEGWRLALAEEGEDGLAYHGVVYNEMKGAMSAPVARLWQAVHSELFPHSTYRHNSGGDPAAIPDLTYEQLRAFHAQFYHPSQAVFMTYGDIPAAAHQARFDELVLARFEPREPVAPVAPEAPFAQPVEQVTTYPVPTAEDAERATHAVWSHIVGDTTAPDELLDAHLLAGVLLDNGASPLRRLFETTELADAPSELCGVDDSARQLIFIYGVEGTERADVDALAAQIDEVLAALAAGGIEPAMVRSALDRLEAEQRDLGGDGFPVGLNVMSRALPGVVHRRDPLALLDLDPALARLRERATSAYVADLVTRLLRTNPHRGLVVMEPDPDQAQREAGAERDRLRRVATTLDASARDALRRQAEALDERQRSTLNVAVLPRVGLTDVSPDIDDPVGRRVAVGGCAVTTYTQPTNGLFHCQQVFDLPALAGDEIAALPLFCEYLTELGSGADDYLETQGRRAALGTFEAHATARAPLDDRNGLNGFLVVAARGLKRKLDGMVDETTQLLECARFDERDRLHDLLVQTRVDAEAGITDRGHHLAVVAAAAGLSAGGWLDDCWVGPSSIKAVQALAAGPGEGQPVAPRDLAEVFASIRRKCLAAPRRWLLIGEDDGIEAALKRVEASGPGAGAAVEPFVVPAPANAAGRAWMTNTGVNFCGRAYSAPAEGEADAAALMVLGSYLHDGFLHAAIRERGGAYGSGAGYDPDSATFRFFSYRDPRLAGTLDDFEGALEWARRDRDAERLEESILGVIRGFDRSRSPAGAAAHAFHAGLHGRDLAARRALRARVLRVGFDDLERVLERYLPAGAGTSAVITNEAGRSAAEDLGLEVGRL